jgi:rhodanese-related sulfurtransferase
MTPLVSRKSMYTMVLTLVLVLAWAFTAPAAGAIKSKKEVCREAKAAVPHVGAEELANLLAERGDLLLLDIRTEAEYRAGHVAGARWLAQGFLEFEIQELCDDPDRPVVVYCLKGCCGSRAAQDLRGIGFRDVRDLDGGLEAWIAAGQPLYNELGEIRVTAFLAKEPGRSEKD